MRLSIHRIRAALALATAALAVAPSAARAADLHVTTTGSGDCTSLAAACSFQAALGAAQPGDQVVIHAGVYDLTSTIEDAVSGVSIVGAAGEARPVFDLMSAQLNLTHGTGLASIDVVGSAGTALTAAGGLLDDLRITATGARATAVRLGDAAVLRNSNVIVRGAGAVGVAADAEDLRAELRGATVLADGTGATAALVAPTASANSASLRAVNTILQGTGGATDLLVQTTGAQTASALLDHVASDPADQVATGAGASIDDSRAPLAARGHFIDPAAGDLRQTELSPTIDAGTADVNGDGTINASDAAAAGASDLSGAARQLGDPDVGSDEREMPPIVLSSQAVVSGGMVALQVTVQPRGLATEVAAEWTAPGRPTVATASVAVQGNLPVTVTVPFGAVPSGAQLSARAHASNGVGTTYAAPLAIATPAAPVAVTPVPTPIATRPVGALPALVSKRTSRHWGIFAFRLDCRHQTACRGNLILSRLGSATRRVAFNIAAGKTELLNVVITTQQQHLLQRAGGRGRAVELELRSYTQGSSFTIVRLRAPKRLRSRSP